MPQSELVKMQKVLLNITEKESRGVLIKMKARWQNKTDESADKNYLIGQFREAEKYLYSIADYIKQNEQYFGNQLSKLLVEHLCMEQILIIKYMLRDELGIIEEKMKEMIDGKSSSL